MMCYVLVGLLYHNKQIKNISHFYKYTKLSSSKKYGKILPIRQFWRIFIWTESNCIENVFSVIFSKCIEI